jgi:nitric oxide reductase NorD protein
VPPDGVSEGADCLDMLASALAGRPVAVAPVEPGGSSWSDGHTVHIDLAAPPEQRLRRLAVQASLIAAGSLDPDIVGGLARRTGTARRYLATEGRRALRENAYLLPATLSDLLADADIGPRAESPAASLALASSKADIPAAPAEFGVLRPKDIVSAGRKAANQVDHRTTGHVPRRPVKEELEELDDGELDETAGPDLFSSPVGGAGFIGKWLKKLLSSARGTADTGGGPPGADAPTHRTNSANRGARAVLSTASVDDTDAGIDLRPGKFTYPEWDVTHKRYRPQWCTVHEVDPTVTPAASGTIDDAIGVARPLARLGMGLYRRRRQAQGDDIDIDAAIEERLEVRAGSVPDEAVYLNSLRCRRDLSVLLLLDVSGSAAEPGSLGRTVHQQQRAVAAALTVALHDLGDRVALYAYYSQGRAAVNVLPVKRFGENLSSLVIKRLNSLQPGAYSRLGAAIRHGSAIIEAEGGTPRRLLVVLSDGLAYDHGYERDYGAADARRALTEARRRGTGCVCLTVGASTEAGELRAVFGSAAHANVGRPDQLPAVIGPIFRSALRSAEVRRRVS